MRMATIQMTSCKRRADGRSAVRTLPRRFRLPQLRTDTEKRTNKNKWIRFAFGHSEQKANRRETAPGLVVQKPLSDQTELADLFITGGRCERRRTGQQE